MLHQSKIRKTALLLIYAMLEQGASAQDFDYDIFWDLALAKDIDQVRLAQAKAIIHVCRASADLTDTLKTRGETLLAKAQTDGALLQRAGTVQRLLDCATALQEALATLRDAINDKRREGTDSLLEASRLVLQRAEHYLVLVHETEERLSELPGAKAENFCGAMRRLQRMLTGCTPLKEPEKMETKEAELLGFVQKSHELAALRPAAQQLAVDVYSHRDEWEESLSHLLRNYMPNRLDNVDKAILYLSLHELKYRKLDVRIVVSEATNLAHEFSGSKSAPFVHGIIATAAGNLNGGELPEVPCEIPSEQEKQPH